ncbi:MAG: prevent-host-death protein [Cyclobacteriaceae bacterium]|nr:MAG: prevent-host-death protein [Cyclobacteriaceae bacterium]
MNIGMKLFLFSILQLSLLVSYSQQRHLEKLVSLNLPDASLEEVLDGIGKSAGVTFSYSSNKIPVDEKVALNVSQQSVESVLKQVLAGFPVEYQVFEDRIILRRTDMWQTVRGRVIDTDSKSPVFGVTVVVLNTDPLLGAVTDSEGKFRIEKVPVGRHDIRIQSVGYLSKDLPNVLVSTGKETVLELRINESITQMDEVVINSMTTIDKPLNELAVVSGRSFTEEETRRYAASVGDPARLVAAYAGVVQGDDGTNEIIIRGNSSRGLLWKLEGVEIPSPNHFSSEGAATGGISMFSTQVIDRSDFLTGAFPAEYGNAFSGVFDIHLRKGNNQQREYTLQAGFLGLDVASEGPFKKGSDGGSYLFNYRYSTLGILTSLGLLDDDASDETNIFQDLSFKLQFPTRKAGTFSLFGLGGLSAFEEDREGEFIDRETYNMGVVGLSHEYQINPKTYIKSIVSWSGTQLEDRFEYENVAPNIDYDNAEFTKSYVRFGTTVNKKVNSRQMLEVGAIYSGLSFNFQETNTNTFNDEPYKELKRFQDSGSSGSWQGYGTYKYQLNDRLSLIGGVHLLHFNFNQETSIEPRAGVSWMFKHNQVLSFGFGDHSKIESLEYYLGRFVNPDGSTEQLNKSLKLTKARHYVLSYQRQLSTDWSLRLETYYQDLYDIPVVEDTRGEDIPLAPAYASILFQDGYTSLPLVNRGTGRNYGIEMTLEKRFTKDYFVLLTGSVYEAKYKGSDGIERDSRLNGNFNNTALAGKEFHVGRNGRNNVIGINFRSALAGNRRYTPIDIPASIDQGDDVRLLKDVYTKRYPNYYRLDLQLSYRKNKPNRTSEWRLDIQNLTNRGNILHDYYIPESQTVGYETQIGLIPVLSYRIQF